MTLDSVIPAVRIPQDLRDELEAAANAEQRSLSNYVRCILEDWRKRRERQADELLAMAEEAQCLTPS